MSLIRATTRCPTCQSFRRSAPLASTSTSTSTTFKRLASYAGRTIAVEEETKALLKRQLKREWKTGDVYAPHDMHPAEMRKWNKKSPPTRDVFDILNINPLTQYKNFSLMADFVTEMGRIRPRSETGLRPVNQRKIARAIKRAIALGLMPSVYKHPEIIKRAIEDNPFGRY